MLRHYTLRRVHHLETNDDHKWLSEYLCFVRSDCVEVFEVTRIEDAGFNMMNIGQAGLRCRFCAHLPASKRGCRSLVFPSSVSRIYQCLTMMIRDHFPRCKSMPPAKKEHFNLLLKAMDLSQGATDSKRYWIESGETNFCTFDFTLAAITNQFL